MLKPRGLMELDGQSLLNVATVVGGGVLVWANAWRALLTVKPSALVFEVEDGSPDAPVPGWLEPSHERLLGLGFRPLGSFLERRRAGPIKTSWAYAHDGELTYAVVADSPLVRRLGPFVPPEPKAERDGPAARLTFITTAQGRFLLSSNFRRPGTSIAGSALCAGLPNVEPDRLFRAHQRRVAEIGGGEAPLSLDALIDRLTTWTRAAGGHELRRQHAVGLLWTLGGLGMVAGAMMNLVGTST